jgi:hypothetical protein
MQKRSLICPHFLWDSTVTTETGYWLEVQKWFDAWHGREISLFSKTSRPALEHIQPLFYNGYW